MNIHSARTYLKFSSRSSTKTERRVNANCYFDDRDRLLCDTLMLAVPVCSIGPTRAITVVNQMGTVRIYMTQSNDEKIGHFQHRFVIASVTMAFQGTTIVREFGTEITGSSKDSRKWVGVS